MKYTAILALALASAALAADPAPPKTLLAEPDRLLFSDDLSSLDAKQWRAPKGQWEIVDGVLKGAEKPEDKHGAVTRHAMKMRDFILSVEIKLDGARLTTVTINDAKEHVARVSLAPGSFRVNRDDHDHDGPDKAIVFLQKPVKLEPGQWHSVVLEMVGDTMVATLDDKLTGFGSDELFKVEKANPGLTVGGQSASFRNFRVWSAKPEAKASWNETKAKRGAK